MARLFGDQSQREQLEVALRQHAADAEPIAPSAASAFAVASPTGALAEPAKPPRGPMFTAAAVFRMSQSMHLYGSPIKRYIAR